jgi:hypothetical protein
MLIVGCQSASVQPEATSEIMPGPTQEGDVSQMTASAPTPAAGNIQALVDQAKSDLAQRLSLPTNEIDLVEVTEVEWSDASLDCPQPGISYLQVITPGYRILLNVNDQAYEYHSNRDAYVVYCENNAPLIPPKP